MEPSEEPRSYRPPSTADRPEPESTPWGCWRDGSRVVLHRSAELPASCVRCGAPAAKRVPRVLRWIHPVYYLLLLGGLLPYLLVSLFVTRRMRVEVPLCDAHARRRRRGILLGIAGVLGVLGLVYWFARPLPEDPGDYVPLIVYLLAGVACVGMMVTGSIQSRTIRVKRLDPTHGWFTAGEAFLAGLHPLVPDETD